MVRQGKAEDLNHSSSSSTGASDPDPDDYFGFSSKTNKKNVNDQSIEMIILSYLEDPDTSISSLRKQFLVRNLFPKYLQHNSAF